MKRRIDMSKHQFQTEVNQLLNLIIHSLYSHKEIFIRELISNASDALDKLKYLNLTDEKFKELPFEPRIDIEFNEKDKTLTISDTGLGMNEKELVENLGTIASSGTKNFLSKMTGNKANDANLIGQFGVGFYSAFMVSKKVEVISKKAGDNKAYKWISDGESEYEIEETERKNNGTTITCYLNEEGEEYTNRWQIENIVKKYSNHIPFPIFIHYEEIENKGDEKKEKKTAKIDQVNAASAFWKRPKSELKKEDYDEFYKTLSHDSTEPLLHIHTHAEGTLQYSTLFYIPKKAPWDMFKMDYQTGVKLYVKRIFITDEDKELMPSYLRFVKGVIDSEDLPLNISREILQKNKILANIRNASVKKILSEIGKLSTDKKKYNEFWTEFGNPLKEGLYSDFTNKDTLLELVRFKSTKSDGLTSFAEYKSRMKPDQKTIYYISGGQESVLRNSPLIELYKKKDIEVLIMDSEIDEIIIPSVNKYKDVDLKSVNRSDAADDLKEEKDKEAEKEVKSLVNKIKEVLKDHVKDVKASTRLSDSPSCIVADQADPTMHMQHLMKAMGQDNMPKVKPILEINPEHEIIKKLNETKDKAVIEDVSWLLLEQAMIIEGVKIEDPTNFIKRLNKFLSKGI
jgi:molecular chaperone HtpG